MNSQSFHIGLFSPAGALREPQVLDCASAYLGSLGHTVKVDSAATARYQRFAGGDAERLAAVCRMRDDQEVDLAIATRGGYGWTRLLHQLDYHAWQSDTTLWLGHSDFTAFSLAMLARAQRITFAGPMACSDFGGNEPSAFTVQHCFNLLSAFVHKRLYTIHCQLAHTGTPHDLQTQGILWGGNLSILAHLVGTPFFPNIENGILFIEDIGEAPYRIERMLYQLLHSGVLSRQTAVLVGGLTEAALCDNDNGYDLNAALSQLQSQSGVPFFSGLPFGHLKDKLTLPVGAQCTLAVDDSGAATLAFAF